MKYVYKYNAFPNVKYFTNDSLPTPLERLILDSQHV